MLSSNEKRIMEMAAEYLRNVSLLEKNLEKLRLRFPNRYVAVYRDKVIDAGSLDELMEKLSGARINPSVCAVDLLTKEELSLVV